MDGLAKTNNSAEGSHRGFSSLLGVTHPTIFKFVQGLLQQQALIGATIVQSIAGATPNPSRPNYRDAATRLKKIVCSYGTMDNLTYLEGVAHNLRLNSCDEE
jgi:hypothetical protein